MNDDTDKPLNTVGDDALEARITAWVLGEASSFEAGELEKLCVADPASRLFERRLRVLHGLVAEDFKAGPAAEWKLAAARRAKITDLLGVAPEVEQVLPRRDRHRGASVRGLILALAACVVIGVASYSVLGGVGSSAKHAVMKERARVVTYSAAAPQAMVESASLRRDESGVPVTKPDSSYAHLAQNSAFTSKPPPPAMRAVRESRDRSIQEPALKGVDLINRGAGAGGPSGAVLAESSASPVPGAAPDAQALAFNERQSAVRAKESAAQLSEHVIGDTGGVAGNGAVGGIADQQAEAAPGIALRGGSDFILPVERKMIPEEPAATGTAVTDIVTAGNRSGDAAVSRNNIDAILNNPARQNTEGEGQRVAAPTGMLSDEEIATVVKPLEEMSVASRRGLEPGSLSDPDGEFLSRNVDSDKVWNGRLGGKEDPFGGAGGVPQEPAPGSRFKMDLRAGSERTPGENDAATFGDLEEMGRLAGEGKPQKGAGLGGGYYYSRTEGQAVDGISDLSDLARKQNEMVPPTGSFLSRSIAGDVDSGGLADSNAPAADPAMDPFSDTPAAAGQSAVIGGLKRDLSVALESAPVDRDRDVRAKLLEEVDKAWELSVPSDEKPAAVDPAAPTDPTGTSQPLTAEHARMIDEVRRKLYIAEGTRNLGKYDESQKTYEEVLRIDPYNKAARRGMEKVAAAKADYYRAAYDHTRAKLQVETDEAGSLSDGSRGFDESESMSPEFVIRTITDLENERRQWREQIATLGKVDGGALFQYASGLSIPDNVVPVLLPQLQEAHRQLEGLKASGVGPSHPSFSALSSNIESMDSDVKEAIENLKSTLTAKMALADEQVSRLASKLEPAARESVLARLVAPVVVKPVVVEPTAEIAAADEPFSTFSLHVSDASFKLAHAAMERGEVPAAEGIRPEEFYNAFDYGDPAPASGEPVVCVTEQSAHPAFPQRNLLRIGVRTGSQGRGASTPLNLTLLLDHSGSMEREDRNAGLAMAVRQLSGLLKEGDTITVAGFSRQPRLLADRLPGARAQELNDLIARTPSEGGTNLEEGLKLGEELAKRQFNPAAQNRVVLFTDGAANLGDARPEALQARIEGLRQQGIAFDAAGFGADGLNDKLLERLTRNGNGRYYIVDGPEDADAGFAKQLAGAFRPAAENVKVQVRFNPARVAKYKLIGFEEHRLQKEDFRNDAVDAAEMAAEEAGNALYQIEVLPQGEGEVGEVSVRFRDVASGQMVERTWTIPYDAQAPAFDQATPSIQLAGLAAFAAEKLRAAPMADAVDFQQLGQVYAGVRARYPNSRPVADLGSMIGKMK